MAPRNVALSVRKRESEIATRERAFIEQSQAKNTTRTYRAAWNDFVLYCTYRGVTHLPALPSTIAAYLTELSEEKKVSTLDVKLAAISWFHVAAGETDPTKDGQVPHLDERHPSRDRRAAS